jgi:hypothetical protein
VTRLRRSLLLVVVTVATVLGVTAGTAQAAYTDKATLAPLTVGTLTVAAPTALSTAGTYCTPATWYSSSTLHAKLSWKASATTRGITGYRITAWFADGSSYPIADVGPTTTVIAKDVDASFAAQNIRITVSTLTAYGWTAQTAKTGAISC